MSVGPSSNALASEDARPAPPESQASARLFHEMTSGTWTASTETASRIASTAGTVSTLRSTAVRSPSHHTRDTPESHLSHTLVTSESHPSRGGPFPILSCTPVPVTSQRVTS
eukprot:3408052-Pyramimonas_sp.AAC.3